jgi:hypothetical protein
MEVDTNFQNNSANDSTILASVRSGAVMNWTEMWHLLTVNALEPLILIFWTAVALLGEYNFLLVSFTFISGATVAVDNESSA